MSNQALIIFIKNPKIGKVKTRLAKDIGDEEALKIYYHLLQNIRKITENVEVDKFLYYSNVIEKNDSWDEKVFFKRKQKGSDIGERMYNAIDEQLKDYQDVVLIGSDILELKTEIIEKSFDMLKNYDVTIGPAKDGGYYLIGMNKIQKTLFFGKRWSTSTVFNDTMQNIQDLGLKVSILPMLSDIDNIDDLKNSTLKKLIT